MNCAAVEWALAQKAPSSSAKFLLVAIASRIENGKLAASQAELAEIVDLCDRQVRTLLKQLEAAKLISRTRNGGAGVGRTADTITLIQQQPEETSTSEQAEANSAPTGKIARTNRKKLPRQPADISVGQPEDFSPTPEVSVFPQEKNQPPFQEQNPERIALVIDNRARPRGQVLADEIAERVNSPYLDPSKSYKLYQTCGRIQAWMDAGADVELDIIPTVSEVCRKLNGHGQPIERWTYFDKPVAKAITTRLASSLPLDMTGASNEQSSGTRATSGGNRRGARSKLTESFHRALADDQPLDLGRVDSCAIR